MTRDILSDLERRLGPLHAKQRLGIETDHEDPDTPESDIPRRPV